jgi:signal transduction histidine kinase
MPIFLGDKPSDRPRPASSATEPSESALYRLRKGISMRFSLQAGGHDRRATCTRLGLFGLCFRTPSEPPLKDGVKVELDLTDGTPEPLETSGTIVSVKPAEDGRGFIVRLHFDQLAFLARRRLYAQLVHILTADASRPGSLPALSAGETPSFATEGEPAKQDDVVRILVVDDDFITRRLVQRKVSEIPGAVTIGAGSGEEAMQCARERIDLAFLDVRLPDTDGLTLLGKLRERHPAMSAIVITNYPSADVAIKALRSECSDFIKKPFANLDDVRTVALKTLRSDKLAREREALLEQLIDANRQMEDANKRLRDTREELIRERALTSLTVISAGLAHQINNPTAIALASVELLRQELQSVGGGLPDGWQERMADTEAALERVARIARDLHVFAVREDSGTQEIDLADLVRGCLRIVEQSASTRAYVSLDLGPDCVIKAQPSEITDVIRHLMSNAFEALPAVGGRLNIRCARGPDGVTLELHDNGHGMSPEVLREAFTPMFSTRDPSARGMGLAVVHGIVTGMGGRIDVDSEAHVGTRIAVSIPANEADARSSEELTPIQPREGDQRRRVLIVDDEHTLRKLFAHALSSIADVTQAGNGLEALAAIRAADGQFDCIVADLLMPEMGGAMMFAEIQREWPELADRVVFCTGGATTESEREFCRSFPRSRVVEKPVRPAVLRSVVADNSSHAP